MTERVLVKVPRSAVTRIKGRQYIVDLGTPEDVLNAVLTGMANPGKGVVLNADEEEEKGE